MLLAQAATLPALPQGRRAQKKNAPFSGAFLIESYRLRDTLNENLFFGHVRNRLQVQQ